MKKKNTISDLDNPNKTLEHRSLILSKPFLKKIYTDWYQLFIRVSKSVQQQGHFVEIGSGGGFLKTMFPEVITSDILQLPHVDLNFSAEKMPFENNSVSCIMMLNVFHHIPRPYLFLREAERVLVEGGKIIMIEPANTFFSRFVYKHFHHEPFDPKGAMEINPGNPLSNSNQALPYIYFERESDLFRQEYGSLNINYIHYHTPFRYILSGGLSRKTLVPTKLYGFIAGIEKILSPLSKYIGLFCTIEIEKTKS